MRDDIATLRAKYEAAKNRYAVGDKVVLYPDGGRQVEKKIVGEVILCEKYFLMIKSQKGVPYTCLYADIMTGEVRLRRAEEKRETAA